MRILFVGDVVGKTGRLALRRLLGPLRSRLEADLVIVNGENAAGGAGLTPANAEELFAAGADVLTLGNHTWDQKSLIPYLDENPNIIRPVNLPPGLPGRGWLTVDTPAGRVGVLSLLGRVFLPITPDDPFRAADEALARIRERTPVIIVDFHAEATSEKQAMGWYLDGRVTALIGTHTHVQTADARILPGGSGYVTDVGMTGARDSVIGIDREAIVRRFLTQQPVRFEAAQGDAVVSAALLRCDPASGRCLEFTAFTEFVSNPAE
ncbi:MAG TPA: TIGR00282 family metallophosphoesterase [Bacillota bacterium]